MRLMLIGLFLLSFITYPIFAQMTQLAKPKVIILTTGGTIASRTSAPMIDGPALVQAVPDLLSYADIEVEEFSRIGSSQMKPEHWLKLAKRINDLFHSDPDLNGVVITHGTDTMEETAFFLNLTVKSDKPVVLVGSMRSANEISADGPANLLNAVRVAVTEESIGKGVLLVLNEDISGARDVWKTDNRRVHTFQSSSAGFLGTVDPDTVLFFQNSLRLHTTQTEFDISVLDQLPRVEILTDFTGIDPSLVSDFVSRKPDGLVIRTFAGGRMSAGMREGLMKAGVDIPKVITSRVPGGRIVGKPHYDFPAVIAADLPDNKARILLMLGLTSSKDLKELQRIFETY